MRLLPPAAALGLVLGFAGAGPAELYTWVDEEGRTHVSDDLEAVPEAQRDEAARRGAGRGGLWDDGLRGPPVGGPGDSSSSHEDRVQRLLRGAVDDLRRGEAARATAALRSVLDLEPARPEAHWYLALLDRQRGRFGAAEEHLRAFLAHAGEDLAPWRGSAERRLRELEDERRLAAVPTGDGPLPMRRTRTPHFVIHFDAELGRARPDYLATVTGYLEDAHAHVTTRLGAEPAEPTRVLFYGRGAYLRAHRHRFSFRTVGFFDGRIHVASAAHPGGELRSLLHHEYTHALFREQVGSDRPMWLNEGLAELVERSSRRQPALARGERFALHRAMRDGSWIALRRLEPGFGGLDDAGARLAYLEAIAAAHWIESRTDGAGRARLLALLGEGRGIDAALRRVVGVDVAGLEAALRRELEAEFPAVAPASPADQAR